MHAWTVVLSITDFSSALDVVGSNLNRSVAGPDSQSFYDCDICNVQPTIRPMVHYKVKQRCSQLYKFDRTDTSSFRPNDTVDRSQLSSSGSL